MFINEKLPLKTNIPIFHHSIILPPWRDEAKRTCLDKPFSIFPLWRDRNSETFKYMILGYRGIYEFSMGKINPRIKSVSDF